MCVIEEDVPAIKDKEGSNDLIEAIEEEKIGQIEIIQMIHL